MVSRNSRAKKANGKGADATFALFDPSQNLQDVSLHKKLALKGLTGRMKQVDLKGKEAELNKTSLDDGNGGRINYKIRGRRKDK